MDTTPLISIIVPVYNVEKYLSRCIESILSQSYKNLELILVDDGSTDLSYEICKKYKAEDNRVIITNQKNAGSSVARNTGLSYAKGEFIGFVDSDDWVLPNMFDVMISKALKHKLNIVERVETNSFGYLFRHWVWFAAAKQAKNKAEMNGKHIKLY